MKVETDFDKDETYIGTKCDFDSLAGKKVFLVKAAFTDCGKEIPADTLCEVLVYRPGYLLLQAYLVDRCYNFYVENSANSIRMPAVVVVECDACGEEIEVLQDESAKQEFHYCTDCEEAHTDRIPVELAEQKIREMFLNEQTEIDEGEVHEILYGWTRQGQADKMVKYELFPIWTFDRNAMWTYFADTTSILVKLSEEGFLKSRRVGPAHFAYELKQA